MGERGREGEREREREREGERERTSGQSQSVCGFFFFLSLILFDVMGLVLRRRNVTEKSTLLLSLLCFFSFLFSFKE